MNPVYVVLIINLIIWLGIFIYLFSTDKKVRMLKKQVEKLTQKSQGERDAH